MAATVKHALTAARIEALERRVAALEAKPAAEAKTSHVVPSGPEAREALIAASMARRAALRAKANR